MSKTSILFVCAVLFLIVGSSSIGVQAREIEATITITTDSIAHVRGRFTNVQRPSSRPSLSFMLDHGGVTGLGERISDVRLTKAGSTVPHRRMIGGEYLADGPFRDWSYSIDLKPLPSAYAAAHLSWLTSHEGLIMLDDLLPLNGKEKTSAKIKLELPAAWSVVTTEHRSGDEFDVADVSKAVFRVAPSASLRELPTGDPHLRLLVSGNWLFTDKEAAEMVSSVFGGYRKMFGSGPPADILVSIQRFPISVNPGNWEADTRGSTITIASSDMPFKSQSVQRLHEQLRHEIFHLWIPNAVNLTGNYDWFYEGFALYESLKMGVAVNRIRFDDMLDTLSRAYDIDRRAEQTGGRRSLVEASKGRWQGSNTTVYARGMLIAFLTDLALLNASNGKRSSADLSREVYAIYASSAVPRDGNEAVIDIMSRHKELIPITDRYIKGSDPIDWRDLLSSAGIQAAVDGSQTKLAVAAKPSGRQTDLLNKLGYNSWRKLSQKQ